MPRAHLFCQHGRVRTRVMFALIAIVYPRAYYSYVDTTTSPERERHERHLLSCLR